MDKSDSVGTQDWQVEKRFVSDMITTGISNDSSVSVVTFATGAWSHWNFKAPQQPRSIITDKVENISYDGGGYTYTEDGFNKAIDVLDATGSAFTADKLVIFITDGDPSPSQKAVCSNSQIPSDVESRGLFFYF